MKFISIILLLAGIAATAIAIACIVSNAILFDSDCISVFIGNMAASASLIIASTALQFAVLAREKGSKTIMRTSLYVFIASGLVYTAFSAITILFIVVMERDCVAEQPVIFTFAMIYITPVAAGVCSAICALIAHTFCEADISLTRLVDKISI